MVMLSAFWAMIAEIVWTGKRGATGSVILILGVYDKNESQINLFMLVRYLI